MILDNIFHLAEPESRHAIQDGSFSGDGVGHDHVKGGNPVGSDDQQEFFHFVNITYFPSAQQF